MPDDVLLTLLDGLTLPDTLSEAVPLLLRAHGHPRTALHCAAVAAEARKMAERFGIDADKAETGGWLHDISAAFTRDQRLPAAKALGLEILPEEEMVPMIVHQKLSAEIARQLFGVRDEGVLSAIRCHTTLRPGATPLDMVVFLADKIAWDRDFAPPFLDELLQALDDGGLPAGCLVYMRWLKGEIKVVHPWFAAALEELEREASER